MTAIMDQVCNNKIQILFITPERFQSPVFIKLVREGKLPPVNFVCVDEAHCMSEWSHNFRFVNQKFDRITYRISDVLGSLDLPICS